MSALRLARAFTGRKKIVKFEGCYHGHADMLLVKAGSGVATLGLPNSPGVPPGAIHDTLVASYNDLESVRELFQARSEQIAAVIVEPVAGNMGVVAPAPGFLDGLRELTTRDGALLVFDEVMTGFPGLGRWCARALQRSARFDDARQGNRRRPSGGGLRRQEGDHGNGRARGANVSGGDPFRQPPSDDRWDRDAEATEGGVPLAADGGRPKYADQGLKCTGARDWNPLCSWRG